MNIEKLSSGSYRVRQTVNGKTYRVTVDHKPSEKEGHLLIADAMAKKGIVTSPDIPFKLAYKAYIESKANIISPTTIASGYNSIVRQISEGFKDTPISSITKPMVQAEVNRYAANHAPKSTDNFSGLIISVLRYFDNDIRGIKRPQKKKKVKVYIPSEKEVHAIFDAVKGTKYEVPILLSAMGLRRSEICALTPLDLDGNVLTIDKALVQNNDKEWVIKPTKTEESARTIVLPEYLVNLINDRGFYEGHPEMIRRTLDKTQKKLGIPHFTLHKMRHFFASYLHNLGYSDKQIQEAGGWKSTKILDTVYKHAMEMDKAKLSIANDMSSLM